MAKINLQTPTSRARLEPRGKPYKIALLPGVWLGYRAAQSGVGGWIVIAANGKGSYWTDRFAHADDKQPADGQKVLNYEQATHRARALARGDANAAADRPLTIEKSLIAYETDLTGRGRNSYNARLVLTHLPPHLAAQPLSLVTSQQFRDWRDGLIKKRMLPATINRVLKPAHAAFNRAAKLDKRVAANAREWKVGLEALPNTATARDAVLTDKQVTAAVAAAYDISREFGLYVQVHAEVGARSSQLARCIVGDFEDGKLPRLMVPPSKKGRGGGKPDYTPIPVTASLAARLGLHAQAARPMRRCCCAPMVRRGNPRSATTGSCSSGPHGPPSCPPIRRCIRCGTRRSRGRCCVTSRSNSSGTCTTRQRRSSRSTTPASSSFTTTKLYGPRCSTPLPLPLPRLTSSRCGGADRGRRAQ